MTIVPWRICGVRSRFRIILCRRQWRCAVIEVQAPRSHTHAQGTGVALKTAERLREIGRTRPFTEDEADMA